MSLAPDCSRFADLFGADAREPADQRFVDEHRAACATCHAFAAMLADVPAPAPLDDLARRRVVNRALDGWTAERTARTRTAEAKSQRWKLVALAAGLVAFLAVGAAALRQPEAVADRLAHVLRGDAHLTTADDVPAGAEVWVDGKDSGRRAPITADAPLTLEPGTHTVQLRVDGAAGPVRELVVHAGEAREVHR